MNNFDEYRLTTYEKRWLNVKLQLLYHMERTMSKLNVVIRESSNRYQVNKNTIPREKFLFLLEV